jgi:hypothetical protein
MREQLEKRVEELTAEYRAGQEMLAEIEAKRVDLQQTLLRISGALQVLHELLEPAPADGTPSTQPAAAPAPSPRLIDLAEGAPAREVHPVMS